MKKVRFKMVIVGFILASLGVGWICSRVMRIMAQHVEVENFQELTNQISFFYIISTPVSENAKTC